MVVENCAERDTNNVKGVEKPTFLRVYRIAPKTSAKDLQKFSKDSLEVLCESVRSKNPEEYCSFKINCTP